MYQSFYNLKANPFRLTPDPHYVCMTAQHREALSGLIYSVCTRPGLTVLVGEAGTGKTTLLYSLLNLLEKRRFFPVLCTNPTLTREEFYDFLIMKFGVDCQSPLKSRRLEALEGKLRRSQADGRPSVLIVDESQRLTPELLEEIRLLLNLETPKEKLLQIIISGQPELTEILQRNELRQLKQRVSCICRLKPLTLEELKEYVEHRLSRAGLPGQKLFSDPVIELIHIYSQGIPRLVNSLCDSALQSGFAAQSRVITEGLLKEAAGDLDLIPAEIVNVAPSNGHETPMSFPGDIAMGAPVSVNGHSSPMHSAPAEDRVPLDGYAKRQKGNMGLFSSFLDHWR